MIKARVTLSRIMKPLLEEQALGLALQDLQPYILI
jgi:hypothetical protein